GGRARARVASASGNDRQAGTGHGMDWQTVECLRKRRARLSQLAAPQSERADRVPRVRTTFARIQMTAGFVRQLPFEIRERAGLVADGEPDQSAQPEQRNAGEAR